MYLPHNLLRVIFVGFVLITSLIPNLVISATKISQKPDQIENPPRFNLIPEKVTITSPERPKFIKENPPIKKLFKDHKRERIYFPDQSLYFWVSLNPNRDAPNVLLKGEKTKIKVNVSQLSKSGLISLLMVDQKAESQYRIYKDNTPPTITVKADDPPPAYRRSKIKRWKVSLQAKDLDSGVSTIYISINGNAYSSYQDSFIYKPEKMYSVRAYAIDQVGNLSDVKECVSEIDRLVAIKQKQILNSKGNLLSPSSPLVISRFSKLPAVKDIFVKFASNPKTILKPFQGTALDIALLAKKDADEVDKKTEEKGEETDKKLEEKEYVNLDDYFTSYVDREPPYVIGTVVGDQYIETETLFVSERSKINLSAEDNHFGVEKVWFQFPGQEKQEYQTPFSLPLASGINKINFFAMDKGKNTSQPKELDVYLDLATPKSTLSFNLPHFKRGKSIFINGETSIILSSVDAEAGIKNIHYQLDQDTLTIYTDVVFPYGAGPHQIKYFGVDTVNNKEKDRLLNFFVDGTKPEIFLHFSTPPLNQAPNTTNVTNIMYYAPNSTLFLAASDKDSGIKEVIYQLNEGKLTKYMSPIVFKTKGEYTLFVKVIDAVGNVSQAKYTIIIV